jgi:hypothetical protein
MEDSHATRTLLAIATPMRATIAEECLIPGDSPHLSPPRSASRTAAARGDSPLRIENFGFRPVDRANAT